MRFLDALTASLISGCAWCGTMALVALFAGPLSSATLAWSALAFAVFAAVAAVVYVRRGGK